MGTTVTIWIIAMIVAMIVAVLIGRKKNIDAATYWAWVCCWAGSVA